MTQFFSPKTEAKQKSRIRLVNGLSLGVLTLSVLWILWLILPSQSSLLQLIARSTSPEVSLAFLREINVRIPKNRTVIIQLIDNYYRFGELDKALQLAESILTKEDLSQDWIVFNIYLKLLRDKYHDNEEDIESITRLRQIISTVDYVPDADIAREIANTAIELSMTRKGFEILAPHLSSGQTSYDELISLALQNEDYDSSIQLQQTAFRKDESLAEARKLFELLLKANRPKLSEEFISSYSGKLSFHPEFLALTVEHLSQFGKNKQALTQSKKLLTVRPNNELIENTANLAIATGDLPLATSLILQLTTQNTNPYYLDTLHKLYRWQGLTQQALTCSIQLLEFSPTERQLRDGIEEARALGDIYKESLFYVRLADNNQLKRTDYSDWLNAIEKAQGTDSALVVVKKLAKLRPKDPDLIAHLARLHDYLGNFSQVIKQWSKLKQLRSPTIEEARRFSNAYIITHQPEIALAVLTSPKNWEDADEKYLRTISSLAWETGNRSLVQLSQQQLLDKSKASFDVYRYQKTRNLMHGQSINELVELYKRTGEVSFFLIALQTASETEHQEQLPQLLNQVRSTTVLANDIDILLFRGQHAANVKNNDDARTIYQQVLKQDPLNIAAVNGLLWLAIHTGKPDSIAPIYHRYKTILQDENELWLSFAMAAQLLGHTNESELWYQKLLKDNPNIEITVLLNYATMLEHQEQYETANQLRRYIAAYRTDDLLKLKGGDNTYRSLVSLFVGKSIARTLVEQSALSNSSDENTAELFEHYITDNQVDNVLFWQQRTSLKRYKLPDWQQLSIALKKGNHTESKKLLTNSLSLPYADKNAALQLTGQYQAAWQHGQENLGQLSSTQAESQLRRVHVGQHRDKTHSLRSQVKQNSHWNITRYSLDYYAPNDDGFWRMGSDYQKSGTPEILTGNTIDDETRFRGKYFYRQPDAAWLIEVDLADGVGDQRLGATVEYQLSLDLHWNTSVKLGLNNPSQDSQLLTLSGQQNTVGITIDYQPTVRETASMQIGMQDLSTRFGDDIGHGWNLNIYLSEQLFFADPAWQLYGSMSLQKINLSNKPLNNFNTWHQGDTPLNSANFIDDNYQRIAIGHHIGHGNPGIPGANVPSPRYQLDSSIGYNVTKNQPDITLSAGLGWRIFGNDELYFSADWQSQNRNGDESLSLSLGYYYSF